MSQNSTRSVSVEEFIPVDQVETMLAAAEALFRLLKNQQTEAAVNLKRSMVWMIKYIAPTSEFWDWPVVQAQIGFRTELRVKFIGHGWVIALVRELSMFDSITAEQVERDLCSLLDEITAHITVDAVARLKSTAWSADDIRKVARFLRKRGHRVRARPAQGFLSVGDLRIHLRGEETVVTPRMSRTVDAQTRRLLGDIKSWANDKQRFEGADWCCYKRRRLTVVLKVVAAGAEESDLKPDEISLLDIAPGLHNLREPHSFDLVDFASDAAVQRARFGSIAFPRYGYHLGVLHPRTIVRVLDTVSDEIVSDFVHYVSYLWVSHYTRIWRYLDFEEQFAYASDIRRLRELDDRALAGYSQRALRIEELRSRIELLNRIDMGAVNAYIPPHESFMFSGGAPGTGSTIAMLRSTLIPSTVTQLSADPLLEAPSILETASDGLMRSYGVFVQSASLRMQRVLQTLQVLFIVAAVAQVLALIPVADSVDFLAVTQLRDYIVYQHMVEIRRHQLWLGTTDVSLYFWRAVALTLGSVATLMLLRLGKVATLLKRLLE